MKKLYIISFLIFTSYNCWAQSPLTPLGSGTKQAVSSFNGPIDTIFRPQTVQTSYTSSNWTYASDSISKNAKWEFQIQMNFDPSANNRLKIYLNSDNYNLTLPLNGYFVQIGEEGVQDSYDLYRQDGLLKTKILDLPTLERIANDTLSCRLKVTRDSLGKWKIWLSASDSSKYILQGTVVDNTYANADFFGLVTNFTKNASGKFYSDDLSVDFIEDVLAPQAMALEPIDSTHVAVFFDELPGFNSAVNSENYLIKDVGIPFSALADSVYPNKIILDLPKSLRNGNNLLIVDHIKDIYGNTMLKPDSISFHFQKPYDAEFGDIVINEIFADPTPSLGLPNTEFVELYNTSAQTIYLEGWTFADASTTETFGADSIQAREYLIVCDAIDSAEYSSFGRVIALENMPGLNNDEDSLTLTSHNGTLIDSANYQKSWYKNSEKDNGGWTLERIDPTSNCMGEAIWAASRDAIGGTPGSENSVFLKNYDEILPIAHLISYSANNVNIYINKFIAIDLLEDTANYVWQSPTPFSVDYRFNDSLLLTLSPEEPLAYGKNYQIHFKNINDCAGNALVDTLPFYLAFPPGSDSIAPSLTGLTVENPLNITLTFSETVQASNNVPPLFQLLPSSSIDSFIFQDSEKVEMFLRDSLKTGNHMLIVGNILDKSDNLLENDTLIFYYKAPYYGKYGDILINEIMAVPDSATSYLPDKEFIELYNNSDTTIYLKDWSLWAGTESEPLPNDSISPGGYLIVCDDSTAFHSYENLLIVRNLPSLNNNGDELKLYNRSGELIDSVNYQDYWYRGVSSNGRALERINPETVCNSAENWQPSSDSSGGTPGRLNSAFASETDSIDLRVDSIRVLDQNRLQITFNKYVDEVLSTDTSLYSVDGAMGKPSEIFITSYQPYTLKLGFDKAFAKGNPYQLNVLLNDCQGQAVVNAPVDFVFPKTDSIAPEFLSLRVIDSIQLKLLFNEPLENATVSSESFNLSHGMDSPDSISLSAEGDEITLFLHQELLTADYQLTVAPISDTAANFTDTLSLAFNYVKPYAAKRGDVVINEIFADPTPSLGLPNAEFVELYNTSAQTIYLEGWTFADVSTTEAFGNDSIQASEYIIVCKDIDSAEYSSFGRVIVLEDMPGLNNGSDSLTLISHIGTLIDSTNYQKSWHKNNEKDNGGWSLEKINPSSSCKGEAIWTASKDTIGGTPGSQNSVFVDNYDQLEPQSSLLSYGASKIRFSLNKYVSASLIDDTANYQILPNMNGIASVEYQKDSLIVTLNFEKPLVYGKHHQIQFKNISDCTGKALNDTLSFYLPFPPGSDSIPPQLLDLIVETSLNIRLNFSENVQAADDAAPLFELLPHSPIDTVIFRDSEKVDIFLQDSLKTGNHTFILNNISDEAGNVVESDSLTFYYKTPYYGKYGDLLFSEIMADPDSSASEMPDVEYIEIYNNSDSIISLENWILQDRSKDGIIESKTINPGEYMILCAEKDTLLFQPYGKTIAVNPFPSANNDNDSYRLYNSAEMLIDSISYSADWYRDNEKDSGGWSLENTALASSCPGVFKWYASNSPTGGTPGMPNSPSSAFTAEAFEIIDSTHLQLRFSRVPANTAILGKYSINNGASIGNVLVTDSINAILLLEMNEPLLTGTLYRLSFNGLGDCSGQVLPDSVYFEFLVPDQAAQNDLIINEILFNAKTDGVDYLEIYNNSSKTLDLKNIQLSYISGSGKIQKNIFLSDNSLLMHPQEYKLFSSDLEIVQFQYVTMNPDAFIMVDGFPDFTNSSGSVSLYEEHVLIDSLHYAEAMHNTFISNADGVSLEKTQFDLPANQAGSFHSAAADVGFGTPGYQNSQFIQSLAIAENVSLEYQLFSPDKDGFQDKLKINYQFSQVGYMANINIFDAEGRSVCRLLKNQSLSTQGTITWDGTADNQSLLNSGVYIIFIEIFSEKGLFNNYKFSCVLALSNL